jgi:AcrR family transcriptional regulator
MQATTCMHPTAKATRRRPPARQLLLTAASRVFARDGLEGATTRAISREAGVNEVTLFRLFGTKEHLIEAVVGRAFGESGGAAERPSAGAHSLRDDLARFARRYEDLLVANLPLIRTMIGEIHRHALCQHQALRGIFWPMRAALVKRLGLARKAGESMAGLDPSIAADLFAGAIFSYVIRKATPKMRRDYSASDYREACVDVFLNGITAR